MKTHLPFSAQVHSNITVNTRRLLVAEQNKQDVLGKIRNVWWLLYISGQSKHSYTGGNSELCMQGMKEASVTSEPFLKLKVSDPGCLQGDLICSLFVFKQVSNAFGIESNFTNATRDFISLDVVDLGSGTYYDAGENAQFTF